MGFDCFFCNKIFFDKLPVTTVTVIAISISYLIEVSQFYHAPWIDEIRHTKIGAWVLGFGFKWSDIICYTVGIIVGIIFEFYKSSKDGKYKEK